MARAALRCSSTANDVIFAHFRPEMHTYLAEPPRRCTSVARHVLSAVVAVTVLSACSGKESAPTRVTAPAPSPVALTIAGIGSGSGRVMSSPAGIDCVLAGGATSGNCSARFVPGTVVTLLPEPGTTSVFLTFGGDCTLTSCQTTMEAPRSVTATFVPNILSVVANTGSAGGGRVVSTPAGIDCVLAGATAGTGACSSAFPVGTTVTLQQEATAGAVFQGWSSNCIGNPCTITMLGQRTVDVTYRLPLPPGTLAVTGFGTGAGSVTSSPSGISCTVSAGVTSGVCSGVFPAGASVLMTAIPTGSSTFSGYTGDCGGPSCNAVVISGTTTNVGAGFAMAAPPTPPPTPTPPPPAPTPTPPPEPPATLTVSASLASQGGGSITSSPSGINCTVTNATTSGVCSVSFPANTAVTLTQSPTGTTIFQGWGGDCVGNPCMIAMTAARSAEVTYRVPAPGIVTISGTGTGKGSVSSSPAGISCTVNAGFVSGVCSASFAAGGTVTLLASGTNGSSFDGYSGSCTGGTCALPIVSGVTSAVTAGFTAAPLRLTVAPGSGSAGGGVITSIPAGINCSMNGAGTSGTCSALFPLNTLVTVQQVTSGNAVFSQWTGDCATSPCQVVMSQDRTVLPVFQTQGVAVSGGGTGSGLVTSVPSGISCTVTSGVAGGTCATTFPPGTVVTLNATPSGLASFSGFSGACSGSTCTVPLTTGVTSSVTAQFTAPPTLTLSAATGTDGGGTLTSAPSGLSCALSGLSATGTCSTAFALNTSVTVTQAPLPGSVFLNWVGACTGSGSCVVPLSASRSVQAKYRVAVPGAVTVDAGSGTGSGSVSSSPGGVACTITSGVKTGICRSIFPIGSTVTLIPVAKTGFTFTGFAGSCTGTGPCVLTVPENGDLTVVANFVP